MSTVLQGNISLSGPIALYTDEVVIPSGITFLGYGNTEATINGTTLTATVDVTSLMVDKTNRVVLGQVTLSNGNTLAFKTSEIVELLVDDVVVASHTLNFEGIVAFVEISALPAPISLAVPNDYDADTETLEVRTTVTYSTVQLRRMTLQVAAFDNCLLADAENFNEFSSTYEAFNGTPSLTAFAEDDALIFTTACNADSTNTLEVESPAGFSESPFDDVATFFNLGLGHKILEDEVTEITIADVTLGTFGGNLYGWWDDFAFGSANPNPPTLSETVTGIYVDTSSSPNWLYFSGLDSGDILTALQAYPYIRVEYSGGTVDFDTSLLSTPNPSAAAFSANDYGIINTMWDGDVGEVYNVSFLDGTDVVIDWTEPDDGFLQTAWTIRKAP